MDISRKGPSSEFPDGNFIDGDEDEMGIGRPGRIFFVQVITEFQQFYRRCGLPRLDVRDQMGTKGMRPRRRR